MDTEQIRREMKVTRGSIDRKLDALAGRTEAMKQEATQRILAVAMISAAAFLLVRWRRHRMHRWPSRMRRYVPAR